MRHQVAGVRLSRTAEHRKALFSNLVAALFTHEKIRTTHPKARETRRLAERTITMARRLGDVLTKTPEKRSADESARVVHAIRMARRVCRDRGAVLKLFEEIGPRFLSREGGYTRIVKLGQRPGDAAPMSLLELVGDDSAPASTGKGGKGAQPAKASKTAKGETSAERSGTKPASTEAKGTTAKASKKASKSVAGDDDAETEAKPAKAGRTRKAPKDE